MTRSSIHGSVIQNGWGGERLMTMESKRDLHVDLAICYAATEGPWHTNSRTEGYVIAGDEKCTTIATVIEYNDDGTEYLRFGYHECQDNRVFIAESRQGWPEAIRRALAAEVEVERLRTVLERIQGATMSQYASLEGLAQNMKRVAREALDECSKTYASTDYR